MMQEKIDPETDLPLFTADEFLDEDQIAGFFTTQSARSKKAGGSVGKRKGASTSNQGPPEKIPHLDYEEVDNTEEKHEVEEDRAANAKQRDKEIERLVQENNR